MKQLKTHLPLFQVLKELKAYQRQIVIDHLDSKSCNSLSSCIKSVLKQGPKIKKNKKQLQLHIRQNQKELSRLFSNSKKKKSYHSKKKILARIGGNPLALILSTAIPMLMNLFRK